MNAMWTSKLISLHLNVDCSFNSRLDIQGWYTQVSSAWYCTCTAFVIVLLHIELIPKRNLQLQYAIWSNSNQRVTTSSTISASTQNRTHTKEKPYQCEYSTCNSYQRETSPFRVPSADRTRTVETVILQVVMPKWKFGLVIAYSTWVYVHIYMLRLLLLT